MSELAILAVVATFIAIVLAVLSVGMTLLNRQETQERIQQRIGGEEAVPGEIPAEIMARDADGWIDRKFTEYRERHNISDQDLTYRAAMDQAMREMPIDLSLQISPESNPSDI